MAKKVLHFLKRFFLRACTFLGFLLITVVSIFLILHRFQSSPHVPEKTVLTLSLEGTFTEGLYSHPLHVLFDESGTHSFYKLLTTLKKAESDPRILGLYVNTGAPSLGIAQIQELRNAFLSFRKTGKFIYFYAQTFGEMSPASSFYYLATGADVIGIQTLGSVGLAGVGVEVPFVKRFFDIVGVTPDFIRHGQYKTYTETFTEEKMSPAFRESLTSILSSLSQQIATGIAEGRGIPFEKIQEMLQTGPFSGKEGLEKKLVDRIVYENIFEKEVLDKGGEGAKMLSFASYQKSIFHGEENVKSPKIALVFAEGSIVSDREKGFDYNISSFPPEKIGDASTLKLFKEIQENPSIKAVVYRIDSGGGHAIASDAIRKGLENLRKSGKKVVVSMGNTAASGGYLIALGGDEIVANAGTITGSIGAFSGKFVLAPFFEKWGVFWDHVETSSNARFSSINTPFSDEARVKLTAWVDEIYTFFVECTAQARNLPINNVRALAQGRVWTGQQAQQSKLVDHIGGLFFALERAQVLADLPENPEIAVYPHPKSFFDFLKLSFFEEGAETCAALIKTIFYKAFFASGPTVTTTQFYQEPLVIH